MGVVMKQQARLAIYTFLAIFGLAAGPLNAHAANCGFQTISCGSNISSASMTRANQLLGAANSVLGGLMHINDRFILTDKYLLWMDLNVKDQSDQMGGGMLRGLWTLQGSGEALNFRPDGNWNELYPTSPLPGPGGGHYVLANIEPLCMDPASEFQYFSSREPRPIINADGIASEIYPDGVAYQFEGHLWKLSATTSTLDMNPAVNGVQSIKYYIRYNVGKSSDDIQIETYLVRDGDLTQPVDVSVIINDFDVASSWSNGNARPLQYTNSFVRRMTSTNAEFSPGREALLSPYSQQPIWIANKDPYGHGAEWIISEKPGINQYVGNDLSRNGLGRLLRLRTIYESSPSPKTEVYFTPAIRAYSIDNILVTRNINGGCGGGTGPRVSLGNGWSYRLRQRLSTRL